MIKIDSYFIEPDEHGNSSIVCNECGSRIQIAHPAITIEGGEMILHVECADNLVDRIKKELLHY